MLAYLLLLAAVLTRVLPHAPWFNFTAVGGSLLYFGARRPLREMLGPLAVLMATDFYLTLFSYHYAFHLQDYAFTWAWYAAAIVLGRVLLSGRVTLPRFLAAVVLGPTSFFLVSNFGVWLMGTMYPHSGAGLLACYAAALPFHGLENDLASTVIVAGLAFGVPVLLRRLRAQDAAVPAGAAQ
ncbi:MAG TPA: DUF6580 family putative transport protein [Terracidiphilus sp.]|jgi:hypothetical protein|nr:DUF6580 family putative transport protein [Terracidiphilus sp.]